MRKKSHSTHFVITGLIIIGACFVFLWFRSAGHELSPRTEYSTSGQYGNEIALPIPPAAVLATMTRPVDAGPIYRRAIGAYAVDPTTYGRFSRSGLENDIRDIPAIRILLEAADHEMAYIFAPDPTQLVTMRNEKPDLEALVTLAACARRAAMLLEKTKPQEAMKHYEAVFSLGAKLYRERLTYEEFSAGLTMMAEGATMIGRLDPNRAAACQQFNDARKQYVNEKVLPLQKIIKTIDQPTLERHAGDVLYFARYAPERMWRVEAIFALGRYRFNAGGIGDQEMAMSVLHELAAADDPIIRAAAVSARDMTAAEYRLLR